MVVYLYVLLFSALEKKRVDTKFIFPEYDDIGVDVHSNAFTGYMSEVSIVAKEVHDRVYVASWV